MIRYEKWLNAINSPWQLDQFASACVAYLDKVMIILLGGNGYVGLAIGKQLHRQGLPYEIVSRSTVDYTNREVLTKYLLDSHATFLINAAGYTGRPSVDACELRKAECLAGNALLPGVVRAACEQAHVAWGHISSGCIFTGTKGSFKNNLIKMA